MLNDIKRFKKDRKIIHSNKDSQVMTKLFQNMILCSSEFPHIEHITHHL